MVMKCPFWSLPDEECDTSHYHFRTHLARAPIVPVVTKGEGHTEVQITPGGAKVCIFDSRLPWTSALAEVQFGAALFIVDKGEYKPPSPAFIALLDAGLSIAFYGLRADVNRVWMAWHSDHCDQISVAYVPCKDSMYYIPCIFHVFPMF